MFKMAGFVLRLKCYPGRTLTVRFKCVVIYMYGNGLGSVMLSE